MTNHELHSNPLAPSDDEMEEDERPQGKLSNDDFRKLLMTPRVSSGGATAPQPPSTFAKPKPVEKKENSEASNARKKKKSYYAQLKKEEDERDKELATKYRDRAKERREGINGDQVQTIDVSTTANYKAVAPDARIGQTMAERRKKVIDESKFLGGDMEHTHLVKGLDYALLEKVKAEIAAQEMEELENAKNKSNDKEEEEEEEAITFRTKLGRNIVRAALSRKGPVERNDLFLPGRMTYVFDLDDPYEDLPTAVIRSKADCAGAETSTTLSNNDIVINKLTQILSYLRQGKTRDKKKKDKKEREKFRKDEEIVEATNEDIFGPDDVADQRHRGKHRKHEGSSRADRREGEKRSYFEKPSEEETKFDESGPKMNAKDFIKNINDRYGKGNWGGITGDEEEPTKAPSKDQQDKINKFNSQMEIDSYAECYPGMMEMVDALGDSDDEADYTKMDQGNKKGPVGRWDFETPEEYSSYMSSREALPKAAFQYGVKMADGRKTRRAGPRDEKKELDREWTKIQGIISKRKSDSQDVFASKKAKHG